MTSRDFAYWLQGFFEVASARPGTPRLNLDDHQVALIQKHLALVFKHEIDPSAGPPDHQAELNAIHGVSSEASVSANKPSTALESPDWPPHSPLFRC